MKKIHLPQSLHNPTSYAGVLAALVSLFMFVFLYVLSSISTIQKAYVGVVIFIVIPIFIILGLLLIPIGMISESRKLKREKAQEHKFPILDLNQRQHRNATIIFITGTIIFLFLSALGSYEAYHFTESNTFCGTLCHTLMIPEYTAYQTSPHARVKCAECHIGAGANWYVKSKLSGMYQVYATLTNHYPHPIPTPIEHLRPARETCEECHWPQKVYGRQQRTEIYHLPNEENTRWEIDMMMHTGGGNPALGQSVGIHWHINPDIKIEYITTDEKRLVIPKVIMTNLSTNEKIVYDRIDEPLDDSTAREYETRTMDCMDCHNRPSHIYRTPSDFINIALAAGEADASLPLLKQVGVEVCMEDYESTEQAMDNIENVIKFFYADNYPEISNTKQDAIKKSIAAIQTAFSQNIFPEMKVRWDNYPNHIGHFTSPGCVRCHDDKHVSESGRTISRECNDCHTIYAQGKEGEMEYAAGKATLEFKHPEDIDEAWRETVCFVCHSSQPL